MRLTQSSNFVIHLHLVVIQAHKGQLARCQITDFIGLPSSMMRGGFVACVSNANEQEEPFLGDNRCLNNVCCFVRSSMSRVQISWALFLFLLVLLTSCLLLIMFQNRWKLKPPELMMLELLWTLLGLIYFAGLEFLELSLVTRAPIFAIDPWGFCFKSMRLCTNFLHHITPKLMSKPRSQTEKSRGSQRRLCSPTGRIEAIDLRMLYGLTGPLTRHLQGCLLIGLSLVSHATFQWRQSIEPTGLLSHATSLLIKLGRKGSCS